MSVLGYKEKENNKLNVAKKMLMWGYIASMVMLFSGLTSAYLIKRQDTVNWITFKMPWIFTVNTFVIILSSVFLVIVVRWIKKGQERFVVPLLWFTTFLGIAFLIGQFLGWQELVEQKVFFVGNPGGSFIYVFTGLHALHLIAAVITMLYTAILGMINFERLKKGVLLYNISLFWHSLGILWIYLFLFLWLNQS